MTLLSRLRRRIRGDALLRPAAETEKIARIARLTRAHPVAMLKDRITLDASLRWFHVLAAIWVLATLLLGLTAPQRYRMLLQEDRVVEWATVWLFLCAGVVALGAAVKGRRVFDALVALFCLFVAGEEFSWGQRLFGYFPPEFFLRRNEQQELSVHNLPQSVQPGLILMLALAGHGLVIPLLARWRRASRGFERAGVTAPPGPLVFWYAVAIFLLWWYPLVLTGEWVELLAGAIFLMWSAPAPSLCGPLLASAAVVGVAMTALSGTIDRERDVTRQACVVAEVAALVEDLASGQAGTRDLWHMRRVHKRVFSSISDGFIDAEGLRQFNGVQCGLPAGNADLRRRYGLDPWGSPYWIEVERNAPSWRVTAYSFGPNRRRDVTTRDAPINETDDVSSTKMTKLPIRE